ncbi:HK97 family phage prohead protease [Rhodococcus sp. IEGM 1351]|uniref:HK97 family phage prohead protease n=1 Tax=Rhodococcus sp. IEGM 1351 TaxID=3047089 RepID=UPI0024B739D4|nr:HK97 family phage prohead protease [Rhodococcus sp. IEGM 1351]MDI9934693.1 HK97 family phage prohead protease [Rhodococcus sp. IEGM 1351]
MSEKKLKLYTTKIKSIDDDKKSIRFRISDDSIDRYGEKVDQSWNLKNFLKNPIMLWNHKSWDVEPEDVLGTWSDVVTESDGTYATATFDVDINPKALTVFNQYVKNTLRCVSVGFIPHSLEFEDDTPVLKDNELLEVSCVPIPANANAVALALKDGSLNRRDAQWMLRSMQDGVSNLEEQLNKNAPVDGEEMHVEELKTEIKALADLMTQLGEKVTTLSTNVDTIVAEVEEVKTTVGELKPVEDKSAKSDEDQTPIEPEIPPAKGGEDDQPGAGEDEFDEDAELTPEIQAQIDEEFASVENQ